MSANQPVTKNLRDATITLEDGGAGTAQNTVVLVVEEGDLRFSETHNVINVLDRGDLSHMRQGDEEPVSLSFSLKFIQFIKQTSGTDPQAYEVFNNIGSATGWATSNDDGGDVYTVDILFTITDPTSGNEDETIQFTKVPCPGIEFNEGDEYNTLAFDGQAFMTRPTVAKV